jgi:hypothetical protein
VTISLVESARRSWEEGYRRYRGEAEDPVAGPRLERQVEVVTSELRRRVGTTFTIAQLAQAYSGAESWVREAVAEHAPTPGWARALSLVEDAAFHLYSRGAVDYEP